MCRALAGPNTPPRPFWNEEIRRPCLRNSPTLAPAFPSGGCRKIGPAAGLHPACRNLPLFRRSTQNGSKCIPRGDFHGKSRLPGPSLRLYSLCATGSFPVALDRDFSGQSDAGGNPHGLRVRAVNMVLFLAPSLSFQRPRREGTLQLLLMT